MKITRRQFITGTTVTIGAAGLLNELISVSPMTSADASVEDSTYRGAVAILQGFTNQNSTQLTILFDKNKPVHYRVINSAGIEISHQLERREIKTYSVSAIDKISIDNLILGVRYVFQVIDEKTGKVIDERNFSGLDLGKKSTRFIVASCMKDSMTGPREVMWDRVAQVKPDFVLISGDTCYADQNNDGDEAGFWRRYCEARSKIGHFRQKNLIPTLACWDDHDFGANNGDHTFTKKNMVREIFQLFWDSEERKGLVRGPGQSLMLAGFGQRFFMLDGRYFKDRSNESNTMLGDQQEEFLFTNLENSKDPAWLLGGLMFFGGYLAGAESFEKNHADNFKQILKQLSQVEAPVSFVSGDVHFSEAMNIEPQLLGYETMEYVSSSIHSSHFPGLHLRSKNKRRIGATSSLNFMIFDCSITGRSDWNINMNCVDSRLAKQITHQKTIKRG